MLETEVPVQARPVRGMLLHHEHEHGPGSGIAGGWLRCAGEVSLGRLDEYEVKIGTAIYKQALYAVEVASFPALADTSFMRFARRS